MGPKDEHRQGRLLGLPYDFRRLTPQRLKRGMWNPADERIFLPKAWGWGYGVNLHQLARRLRLIRR